MKKFLSAATALSALLLAACGASNDSARLRNDVSRVYDDSGYSGYYGNYSANANEDYLYERSYGDRRLEPNAGSLRDSEYGDSAYRLYEELPEAYKMGTDGSPRATANLNVNSPRQFQPSVRDAGRTPTPTTGAAPATAR